MKWSFVDIGYIQRRVQPDRKDDIKAEAYHNGRHVIKAPGRCR
jgi:hypothetical protein